MVEFSNIDNNINNNHINKTNLKTRIKRASTMRQTNQHEKINELYQPLIDQAIYIDDQLILPSQLLSSSKLYSGYLLTLYLF